MIGMNSRHGGGAARRLRLLGMAMGCAAVLAGPGAAEAGILNRVGNTAAPGLGMSGAGDVTGLQPGPVNLSLNPAALVTVEDLELYLGGVTIWTNFSLDQPAALGGSHFEALDENFVFPELGAAWRLDGRWILGLQAWVPYGLAADYRVSGPAFPGYQSRLDIMNLSLGAAYQFNEEWSAGLSVDVLYTSLEFRVPFMNPASGAFLGHTINDADGVGAGASFGVLWRPGPWSVGLRYALPAEIDVDGDTLFPAALGLGRLGFDSEVNVPQRVSGGVSYEWNEWWVSAFDATYTDYEQTDVFNLNYGVIPAGQLPLHWEDVVSFHAGNQFRVNERLTLRHGAGWLSSGAPDSTLLPSIPDTPGWVVSGGAGVGITDNAHLDLSVAYAWGDRDIGLAPGRAAAGEMDSEVWLAGAALRFRF